MSSNCAYCSQPTTWTHGTTSVGRFVNTCADESCRSQGAVLSKIPRVVCLDCMSDCAVLYVDDFDPARRADLARVRCRCVDVFVWVMQRDDSETRPVILSECGKPAFDQGDLENWERLATQAMKRCAEVQRWFRETGR